MTTRLTGILFLLASLALAGCSDEKTTDDTSGGADDSSGGGDDSSGTESGYTISGSAYNLLAGTAAAAGLCVHAADPTAAIAGGELDLLSSSTINSDGTYAVTNIGAAPSLGLLMLVADCEGSAVTVMPTATGVASADISGLGDGDVYPDKSIYSIDSTSQANLQAGLAAAGYTGDLATDGALIGFVLDSSLAPVAGAVVAKSGESIYYMNADGTFNTTGTVAETNAMFVIPAGGVGSYTCTATGYSFSPLLAGSQPGIAVVVRFLAG